MTRAVHPKHTLTHSHTHACTCTVTGTPTMQSHMYYYTGRWAGVTDVIVYVVLGSEKYNMLAAENQ